MSSKPARRAQTLSIEQLSQLLHYVASSSRAPLRDYAAFLLSFKAGLRAAEIAGLDWEDVCDARGAIGNALEVPTDVTKSGRARRVPMHPALKMALEALHNHLGPERTGPQDPVIASSAPAHPVTCLPSLPLQRVSPNALQRHMARVATHAGFHGVTSHSGRRTFITNAVREAPRVGATLFDVQRMVGHSSASTTADYVESSDTWDDLVRRV